MASVPEANIAPAKTHKVIAQKIAAGVAGEGKTPLRVWTRGGSARVINDEASFQRAVAYTLEEQGPNFTPDGVCDLPANSEEPVQG